jgi:hypothetical protein
MTTREYLRARVVRLYGYSFPLVLVVLGAAIWGRHSVLLNGLVLIVIAAYLAGYIAFMRRTPCLRCSAPLGTAALNWGSKRQPVAHCPHCGLGIDEQVDPETAQGTP